MGHDEDRAPRIGLLLQELQDLHAGAEVEVPGGFVRHEERVVGGERPGDGHPLLLAAGQLARVVVEPFGQTDLLEHLTRTPPGVLRCGGDLRTALHVLDGGERGEQVEGLKDERDHFAPEVEQFTLAHAGDLAPRDDGPPVGGCVERTDDVEQGRLAAARRAQHHDELALVDLEVDVAKGVHLALTHLVTPRHALGLHHRGHARTVTGVRLHPRRMLRLRRRVHLRIVWVGPGTALAPAES